MSAAYFFVIFMEGIRWIFSGDIARRLGMKMARTAELTAMELTTVVLARKTSCNIKLCGRIEKMSWRNWCGGFEPDCASGVEFGEKSARLASTTARTTK